MAQVLITGAGTGFGREAAFRLAQEGFDVIAGVEIWAQVQPMKRDAARAGAKMTVEKLDVTDEGDRHKAAGWDVDVLVNNAGVLEGGAVADIPERNIRHQFEVNVVGPVLLTQSVVKKMIAKGGGRVVFVSSRLGLNVAAFTGMYAASKHAIEAIAGTMSQELREFNVGVATVNPGPFLTGFNDRGFETWRAWLDDPAERVFDYSELSFPSAQYDPAPVYDVLTKVATGEIDRYRSLVPEEMIEETKKNIEAPWDRSSTADLGERHPAVQASYDAEPETPRGR